MNIEQYLDSDTHYSENSIRTLLEFLEICKEFKEKKKNLKNTNYGDRPIKRKLSNTLDIINRLRSDIVDNPGIDNQQRIQWLNSNDIILITDNNNTVIDID